MVEQVVNPSEQIPSDVVVSPDVPIVASNGMEAQKVAEKLVKQKKEKKVKQKKAKVEKKDNGIVARTQRKLEALSKQEARLKKRIATSTAFVAKVQGNVDKLNTKLEKVQAKKEAQIKAAQSLVKALEGVTA